MTRNAKVYRWLSYLLACFWLIIGILTISSILISRLGFVINLFMGIIFMGIGAFFYLKARFLHQFLRKMETMELTRNEMPGLFTDFNKFLLLDILLVAFSLLLVMFMLFAILHRIFIEGFAVFG